MKFPHRYRIYDVLHKSTVSVLIAGTVFGTFLIIGQGVYYFRNVRPVRKEERKKYLEEKLAKEQTEKEQELLMKQEQPEMLKS